MKRSLALAISVLLAAPLAAQGSVLITGSSDPGAYPGLQEAIDAAADGDIILVRDKGSLPFTLTGKSLIIQADAATQPKVTSPLEGALNEIHDIPAGKTVVLRGLSLRGLDVHDVQGTVWLEDCDLWGMPPALRATKCAALLIEGGTLKGPNGFYDQYFPQTPGRGAELSKSVAWLHGVTAVGGNGTPFHCDFFGFCGNTNGFDAISISGASSVHLVGGSCTGGAGGTGGVDTLQQCWQGGAAGNGIILLSSGLPQVTVQDTLLAGGSGGAGPDPGSCLFGGAGDGIDGQPSVVLAGSFSTVQGADFILGANSPVREGQALEVSAVGAPGALFAFMLSAQPGYHTLAALTGPLLAQPPVSLILAGVLPASGSTQLSAPVPELGAGIDGVAFLVQLVVQPQGGSWTAGSASHVVLLDAGI